MGFLIGFLGGTAVRSIADGDNRQQTAQKMNRAFNQMILGVVIGIAIPVGYVVIWNLTH